MSRKMLCCILCCIAILCLTAPSVSASDSGSQPTGSISFAFDPQDNPSFGGSLELRLVALWDETYETLTFTEDFRDCGFTTEELFEDTAVQFLFVYAESKQLPAQRLNVGADGKARAEGLVQGVYLVSQITPFPGYYCIQPALVSIPLKVDGRLILDVDASPKLEPQSTETTEPTEPTVPTPPPDLPPTGQVNWPVPVLALAGSVLVCLGICLRKGKRNEEDA